MIKLFELFAGYGSQSLALKRLGIEFENVGRGNVLTLLTEGCSLEADILKKQLLG